MHLTALELQPPAPPRQADPVNEEDGPVCAEPALHVRTAVAVLRRCSSLRELSINSGPRNTVFLPAEVAGALHQCTSAPVHALDAPDTK